MPPANSFRGSMEAANVPDLEARLHRMQLDLIDCKLTGQHLVLFGKRVIQRRDLINFCFHMEQLTGAGVPILDGLNDLRESTDHPRLREVVTDLIESIEGGLPLSGALAQHDDYFRRHLYQPDPGRRAERQDRRGLQEPVGKPEVAG